MKKQNEKDLIEKFLELIQKEELSELFTYISYS